jgi:hypothetical protein
MLVSSSAGVGTSSGSELLAGLSVVYPRDCKPIYLEKATGADMDWGQRDRVSGFQDLVAKYEREPWPRCFVGVGTGDRLSTAMEGVWTRGRC